LVLAPGFYPGDASSILVASTKILWKRSSKEERWIVDPEVVMSGFIVSANIITQYRFRLNVHQMGKYLQGDWYEK
tara:strand:+ start:71 stop:295 length:225 start_codon:yes stop_codon:yes gene_type:complete